MDTGPYKVNFSFQKSFSEKTTRNLTAPSAALGGAAKPTITVGRFCEKEGWIYKEGIRPFLISFFGHFLSIQKAPKKETQSHLMHVSTALNLVK